MKKKIFVLSFLLVFMLGAFLSFYPSNIAHASTPKDNFIIRAYGDSISAGYKLADYENYLAGNSVITQDSYPEIFARPYLAEIDGQVIGKGVSGDTTTDLLTILEPYNNGTASDMDEFEDTDIVTLCIGANNVLGVALDNIANYIMGSIDEQTYRGMLQTGLDDFIEEYPKVLQSFEGKKVVVMTIYNPYKYAAQNFPALMQSMFANIIDKFSVMLDISMEYLNAINNVILNSESEDVYVADIYSLFEGFSNEEYLEYLNVNTGAITISSFNVNTIMTEIMDKCDPHPTAAGHNVIAQEHLKIFSYFKLVSNSELEGIKHNGQTIELNVNTIETGCTYKLYKKPNGQTATLVKTSSDKSFSLDVNALTGNGEIYVEVYDGSSNLICTTNSLYYSITVNTHTISTNDNLTGLKNKTDKFTITISNIVDGNYNYKLYKEISSVKTLLATTSSKSFEVSAEELSGQGTLYVEVYENSSLVEKTNSLEFDIVVAEVSLTSNIDIDDVILEENDTITINVNISDSDALTIKFYKYTSSQTTLISDGSQKVFTFNAKELEGEGKFYAEVYYNSSLLITSEDLNYSITINRHSISSNNSLTGLKETNDSVAINVSAVSSEGYTYKLYRKINSTEALLDENSLSFNIDVRDITGKGTLFVKVYKNGQFVTNTNSLNFDILINDFTLESDKEISSIILDTIDTIKITVSSTNKGVIYKLYKEVSGVKTLIGESLTHTFNAQELEGEGKIYTEVYYNSSLITTTNQLSFKVYINEHSIACSDNLTGLKAPTSQFVIEVNSKYSGNYTYRLYKQTTSNVLLSEGSTDFTVNVLDILGSGNLYVEVYKNSTLVTTTNSLSFDIALNQFAISTQTNLNNLTLDKNEKVSFSILGQDHDSYTFKVYIQNNFLREVAGKNFEISAIEFNGDGSIYLDVYQNGNKLYSTNSISYSVTINEFVLSCNNNLMGNISNDKLFTFTITAPNTQGYNFKLIRNINSQLTTLFEGSSTEIEISSNDLSGTGTIYVEVYKEGILISTTENLDFNLSVIYLVVSANCDLTSLKNNDQKIVITADTNADSVLFMLFKNENGTKTLLDTSNSNSFTIKAKQLNGEGNIFIEIYSQGEKIATSNSIGYKYSLKSTEGNGDNVMLIIAIVLVAVFVLTIIIFAIIGAKKKKNLWKV